MHHSMWNSVTYRKWTSKIFCRNSAIPIVTEWLESRKYSYFHFAGELIRSIRIDPSKSKSHLRFINFFVLFRRGTICDPGISSRRRTESDHVSVVQSNRDQAPNMPTYSDMKICYATVPGYRSFRDPRDGSWYIQTMCDVWSQHAHDTHLDDLLKIVGNSAGNRRTEESKLQTCSNEDRGFFKTLYFNPGFYGDRN